MHIGIAGNIGSGKTTLTQLLTQAFGWQAHFESADDNPYLEDFYLNMHRWSFNLQVYFLTKRFESTQRIRWTAETVVQDRTIYEDAYIFAENLFHMGCMEYRDYKAYMELFHMMDTFIKMPDLLIYLRASVPTLMNQIRRRNRSYETGIQSDYLARLNDRYEQWIDSYRGEIYIVDIDNIDFVSRPEDADQIIRTIGHAASMATGALDSQQQPQQQQ